jgi:hypothetical protein
MAIEVSFDGDAHLYRKFAAECRAQTLLVSGEAALARADLPALRRLGHDLCTVWTLLGWDALARRAAGLERCATAGDHEAAGKAWREFAAAARAAIAA